MSKHRIDADDPFWVPPTPEPEEFCVCADIPDPECPYCDEEEDLLAHDCDVEYHPDCGLCLLEDCVTTEGTRPAWHVRAFAWARAWVRELGPSAAWGVVTGSAINYIRGGWHWPFTTTETGVLVLAAALGYVLWLGSRK